MSDWLSLFAISRTMIVREDEIVQGILRPELGMDDPQVRAALEDWGGAHFLYQSEAGTEVTLVRRIGAPPRERWWIHLFLALATFLTTTAAGAHFAGEVLFSWRPFPLGKLAIPLPLVLDPGAILPGLAFSVPLLCILLGHEMGHYLAARRHGMNVSPPFFIPAPWINVIGTFGAFIRLRSAVVNRMVLLDVGMAGPLVSFLLSVPLAALGLAWSRPLPQLVSEAPTRFAVFFGRQPIWLGDSFLFNVLDRLFAGEGGFLILHPFAFAGWLGLFVTALNLIPLGQLDGGHIFYALIGARQRELGIAFLGILLGLGFFWWVWWMWALLILVLGRGTVRHPSVFDPAPPVTGWRRALGWACVVLFVMTFVAIPIRF